MSAKMSNRCSQLPCLLLGLIFVITIQLADNRYIPYTPYYPLHPYHEGGAGYTGHGPPPLHGMMPYDHYQPVWTPHGTFFDQRRKVLRVFPGGGVPVIVDYDKRCSDGFVGVKKHPDHAQYYYACKSDCVIFGKCQDYQFFDESKGQCVPYPLPRFEPVCTEPGHFPVYSNCTLYYTCDCDLKSEIFSCPQGTIYSAAQGKCIEGRQCPPTEIAQGSYMPENCKQKYPPCLENGTFRSPIDCSLYYKCANQTNGVFLQTQFKCPAETLFDTKQELCLPQQQVPCDHVQITHLVYPKSYKSYQSNYYPYVADSEEISDYTVSQPKEINCSNTTTANNSGEEILVSEPIGPDSSDSKTTTVETTESPTTTTTVSSTVLTTASSTEQQTTTITSTTSSQPQSEPTSTEESEETTEESEETTEESEETTEVSEVNTIKGKFPARALVGSSTETSPASTTTEVTATTLQLETDTTMSSSSASSTTSEGSTTALGSSSTSISTTERISTTNSINTTEETATPTISTTEQTSTSDSVSSTSTDDKSSSDIISSTTEQISTATTAATTSETETSQSTSISSTQTDVTDDQTDATSTTTEDITIESLSAISQSPTTTTESSLDTQETLHSSNTNTTTTTATKALNSDVLRDSRSIDSITTDQQIANNVSSTASHKPSEDSESCCSHERMILDDELMLDQSGSSEEYDSSEEDLTTSTVSPLSSLVSTTEIDLSKNSTTTENSSDLAVQSTTETINENNELHERGVLSDEIVISTISSNKLFENKSTLSTETIKVTTETNTSTEPDEEYDSQEYEDDTTTNITLENSTHETITHTTVTNPANTIISSNSENVPNEISHANINERQILSDELILNSTTPNTPKVNNNSEIAPDEHSSTEEYDSEEYIADDETTEASQTFENFTTESSKAKNNEHETALTPVSFQNKDDNIMIIAKNKNEIVKETLPSNTEILEPESKKLSSVENEIEVERNVLSDEIIINATTVSSDIETTTLSTQISQLNIDVTTSTSTVKSNSSTDASFEYESGELDDEEYEDSSERIVLSDEVIVTTTNSPNTTELPINSTTSLPADSILSSTESSLTVNIHKSTTDNTNESPTTEEIDTNASSYEDSEEWVNEEEIESQEGRSDNVVVTSTPSPLNTFDEPPTTQTQTLNTQNTADDNDSHKRLVLSDEIVITTLEPLPQDIAQTQNETSTPICNTTQACNTTQTPSENTLNSVKMINLHMRKTPNKSDTKLEPVNNTNIIIGGSCIQSPFIPTLNLTIYGDINLHIRFCPRPCNETHEHNYEKTPIVDAVWDSNSSNKTMNLQVVS